MIKLISTASYNKDLSIMLGSVVASIILEKIIHLWNINGKREFIFFHKPVGHNKYVTEKSWKEISALSIEDLKYGLSLVGTRINEKITRDSILMHSRPDFDTSGRLINANHLIIYSTRNKATYYELNEALAERAIEAYLNDTWKNYIAPEPLKIEAPPPLSLDEIKEISSFSNFNLPE